MTNDEQLPVEMREADRIAAEAISKLAEHVDSVTILITKRRDDGGKGTYHAVFGAGDFYARYGRAKAWVLGCEADMQEIGPQKETE